MAQFGWAYINCTDTSPDGNANGPSGSLQFMTGSGEGDSSGSANLRYLAGPSNMFLTGNLFVSGTIEANNLDIITTNKVEIDINGNTNFGDSNGDSHIFTGSLAVLSSSTYILSASVDKQTTYVRGFAGNYTPVTSTSHTIGSGDYIIGVRHPNHVTMSVPAATGLAGRVVLIKDEMVSRGTGSIRVTGSVAGITFDGSGVYILTGSNPAISLYSNGSQWFVF